MTNAKGLRIVSKPGGVPRRYRWKWYQRLAYEVSMMKLVTAFIILRIGMVIVLLVAVSLIYRLWRLP